VVPRSGTDGVRGVANDELTVELTLALGRAAARVLAAPGERVLVARDTRRSGPLLEAALAAGMAAEGVAVELVGVLPTPGLAYLGQRDGVPAAMISASHNPFPDNGIKFFAPGGRKLPDAVEARLEAVLDSIREHPSAGGPTGAAVGTIRRGRGHAEAYVDHLVACLGGRRLDGLRLVIDCGHGAATEVAPAALRAVGAEVEVLHAAPDGTNINADCGSTHPEVLQAVVRDLGAHAGLAFDGDADRVMAVDERGRVVDGDQILVILARDLRAAGRLPHGRLAVTVMSNLGMRRALAEHGIEVVETAVGDRYVLEAIEEHGLALGGEQSGHVIVSEHATTGDGILTGLLVLDAAVREGRRLSELADLVERSPQVLHNVRVADRSALSGTGAEGFWAEVRAAEAMLGDRGRVLVRPSGTEPLVRIMVEAATPEQAAQTAERLAGCLTRLMGIAADGEVGPGA
jgi:phosphoglucosamine mutase